MLRQILTDNVPETVKRLAVLDIHTGLGKPGFGEPIYVGPTTDGYETARKWYGEEVKSTMQGTSSLQRLQDLSPMPFRNRVRS